MFKKILVAIDATPAAQQALIAAAKIGTLFQAEFRLVNVVSDLASEQAAANALLAQASQQLVGSNVSSCVLESDPVYGAHGISEVIIAEVNEWPADLVVLGSGNRHGLERFLRGAVEDELVATVNASILVVHPPLASAA